LPAPNDPAAGTVLLRAANGNLPEVRIGHYLFPTDTPAKRHTLTNRIDWNVNSSQSFVFSHQLGRSNDLRSFSGTNRIADSIIGRIRNTDAINITHNWVANAHLINQVRFQLSRLDPSSAQAAGELSPAVLVSFTPPGENSQTQVFGSTTNSSDRKEDRWQIQDTLSWVRGNMTWRFGGDYQHVDTLFIDRFDVTGTYSFTGSNGFVFFTDFSFSRLQQNLGTNSALLK
jgi:hypothetical protein